MAERYTYLYRLPNSLHTEGCPVIIDAGALLRDEQADRFVAQLRLRNISRAIIRAVTVNVTALDTAGRPVADPVRFTYIDLSAHRDEVFAEKKAIPLPDRDTRQRSQEREPRRISVKITEVLGTHGILWTGDAVPEPLPSPPRLIDALSDVELVKQFRLRYGSLCEYMPAEAGDLWFCSCGAVNSSGEETCHRCGLSHESIKNVDMTILAEQRDDRLAVERRRREELDHIRNKTRARTEAKARVIWKHATIAAAVLAVIIGAWRLTSDVLIPRVRYRQAEKLLESYDYKGAKRIFLAIESYKDSAERATEAEEKGEISAQAHQMLDNCEYEKAYEMLDQIGETETILQSKRERASTLIADGDYDTAYVLMEEAGDHDGVVENLRNRAAGLIEAGAYEEAYSLLEQAEDQEAIRLNLKDRGTALLEKGEYEEAYDLLEEAGEHELVLTSLKNRADELIAAEKLYEAVPLLEQLKDEDSQALLAQIKESLAEQSPPKVNLSAQVGDYVLFGSYEQDNDLTNGKEDIEWLVLIRENDRALLVSRYALDARPFELSKKNVDWETSSLREWLNGTFLINAFSPSENAILRSLSIPADPNPKYSTETGHTTMDQVFLLSINEVEAYWPSDVSKECDPTEYAIANHSYQNYGKENCPWWLRTPGHYSGAAAFINSSGTVNYYGESVSNDRIAVRPAVWIDLEP